MVFERSGLVGPINNCRISVLRNTEQFRALADGLSPRRRPEERAPPEISMRRLGACRRAYHITEQAAHEARRALGQAVARRRLVATQRF